MSTGPYRYLHFFIAIFWITLAFSGCKRKEIIENATTRLTRNWQMVELATDDNGNGAIDGYEYSKVETNFFDYYNFQSDNTGNEIVIATNGVETNYPFTWSQTADSLEIIKSGHSVTKYYIRSLSNVRMELITSTKLGLAGYLFQPR